MARDGIDRDYALLRIRAQRPDSYFIDNCDYAVENNDDAEAFAAAFNARVKEILEDG